jgi:hypothetical protein
MRDARGAVLEDKRRSRSWGGLVGADYVAAARDAVVEAGGVPHPVAVAHGGPACSGSELRRANALAQAGLPAAALTDYQLG